MRLELSLIVLQFFITYSSNFEIGQEVVISVPVADALVCPLTKLDHSSCIESAYRQLPFSGEHGPRSCLRLHQLLFNERYVVSDLCGDEVQLISHHFFYFADGVKRNTVWTLKKNLVPLMRHAFQRKIDISAVPLPFKTADGKIHLDGILTLSAPWNDPVTHKTYSAGTRFVRLPEFDRKKMYAIYILDGKFHKRISYVPYHLTQVRYPKSKDEAVNLFVDLLKAWVNKKGVLPYVWGGASYVSRLDKNDFAEKQTTFMGHHVTVWTRPGHQELCTGCDCSSLIIRVAQIAGLPYFCKNTAALSHILKSLKYGEKLQNGDLIWYRGHVLIVTDIAQNLITESVGYACGYGLLHTIPLSKLFKDISTYAQLLEAYRDHRPLVRLDKNGLPARTITDFKLLKMKSIYD